MSGPRAKRKPVPVPESVWASTSQRVLRRMTAGVPFGHTTSVKASEPLAAPAGTTATGPSGLAERDALGGDARYERAVADALEPRIRQKPALGRTRRHRR